MLSYLNRLSDCDQTVMSTTELHAYLVKAIFFVQDERFK